MFLCRFGQFHGYELVSLGLEPLDYFADKAPLETVGLDLKSKNKNWVRTAGEVQSLLTRSTHHNICSKVKGKADGGKGSERQSVYLKD
jgi:uncharacterized protein YwbE